MEIAKKEGPYKTYAEGSPVSKGIFQFDMWGVVPSSKVGLDKAKERSQEAWCKKFSSASTNANSINFSNFGNNRMF